jgi:hypothetical protein
MPSLICNPSPPQCARLESHHIQGEPGKTLFDAVVNPENPTEVTFIYSDGSNATFDFAGEME